MVRQNETQKKHTTVARQPAVIPNHTILINKKHKGNMSAVVDGPSHGPESTRNRGAIADRERDKTHGLPVDRGAVEPGFPRTPRCMYVLLVCTRTHTHMYNGYTSDSSGLSTRLVGTDNGCPGCSTLIHLGLPSVGRHKPFVLPIRLDRRPSPSRCYPESPPNPDWETISVRD
jgi:hypothetical protein